jgi:putative two-component system response regulator
LREYCRVIMDQLHLMPKYEAIIDQTFVENIFAASPLHDVGKVAMPDRILLKPARLTPEEFEIMKAHTTIVADTLRAVDREYPGNSFIRNGIEIAESHHERWDGSGYPNGLAGEAIPLAARIVAKSSLTVQIGKEAFHHQAEMRLEEAWRKTLAGLPLQTSGLPRDVAEKEEDQHAGDGMIHEIGGVHEPG